MHTDWYREVRELQVENELAHIKPDSDVLVAHLQHRDRLERDFARHTFWGDPFARQGEDINRLDRIAYDRAEARPSDDGGATVGCVANPVSASPPRPLDGSAVGQAIDTSVMMHRPQILDRSTILSRHCSLPCDRARRLTGLAVPG